MAAGVRGRGPSRGRGTGVGKLRWSGGGRGGGASWLSGRSGPRLAARLRLGRPDWGLDWRTDSESTAIAGGRDQAAAGSPHPGQSRQSRPSCACSLQRP